MRLILIVICMSSFLVQAKTLGVDEKLTSRIIKLSRSKKTMLVNRGLEDGLLKDQHAKFFLGLGVIARAVLIKISATRSVWAVYRLVDPDEVTEDKILQLKITEPVKLTSDPTKMISTGEIPSNPEFEFFEDETEPYYKGKIAPVYEEAVPEETSEGIGVDPDVEDADLADLNSEPGEESAADSEDLAEDTMSSEKLEQTEEGGLRIPSSFELFGNFNLSALDSSVENSTFDYNGSMGLIDFAFGAALYFPNSGSFLRHSSINVFMHYSKQDSTSVQEGDSNITSETTSFEWALGYNYHFSDPSYVDRFVFYWDLSFGLGGVDDNSIIETAGGASSTTASGDSTFASTGLGMKYLTRRSFGFKFLLDYYQRSEEYIFDDDTEVTKSVSGPRFSVGLFYRF